MDERLRFVASLLDGERWPSYAGNLASPARRATRYSAATRMKGSRDHLEDRPRSPYRHPNQLPFQVETIILRIKRKHATWDAPNDSGEAGQDVSRDQAACHQHDPRRAGSYGLVQRRKRWRYKAQGTELCDARYPKALWCADYKGQYRLGSRRYRYPLTITDYRSRYLLACEGLESTKETGGIPVFGRAFKEFGLKALLPGCQHG
jgi:hypothetical protein